jgi:NAD(P)H-dependent nitrite reductase small subunit
VAARLHSPEKVMAWTKVAAVADVPEGTAKQVKVGDKTLALFHAGQSYHALDDTCPHRGAPLSEGMVSGTQVVCPWHAASFDLNTGANLCPPARTGVACYKVQVVGDEIQVDL